MHRKILVATDGSRYSTAAVKEAVALAKACSCPLVIVSVVDVTDEFEALAPGLEEKMIKKTKKMLAATVKQTEKSGLSVDPFFGTGDAYKIICEVAKKKKADLIVLGSHGRTGLKRLLIGSVAERVIGHAPCSVLVVKS